MLKNRRQKVYISFLEELSLGIYMARGIIADIGVTDVQEILDGRVSCRMYIHSTRTDMMEQIAKWNNSLEATQKELFPYGEKTILVAPVKNRRKDTVHDN